MLLIVGFTLHDHLRGLGAVVAVLAQSCLARRICCICAHETVLTVVQRVSAAGVV